VDTLPAEPAVVFDMDGVIVDSEPLWILARKDLVRAANGRWIPEADTAMMGIGSDEWSVYMRDHLNLNHLTAERIRDEVIARMIRLYGESVPLIPGAREAVEAAGRRWRLAIASGSDRVLLGAVLASSGLAGAFAATVSAEDVAEGKPSPLIYEEACRRLGARPTACVAIEDSGSGIASALAAGMKVIAVPRRGFEPDEAILGRATLVLPDLRHLEPETVERVLASG
jgi:HAD superfamily hydrolase (TIGR01509 family)